MLAICHEETRRFGGRESAGQVTLSTHKGHEGHVTSRGVAG